MREAERGETLTEHVTIFTGLDLDRTILKSTTFFQKYAIPHIGLYYPDDHNNELADDGIDRVIVDTIHTEKNSRGRAFDFVGYFNEQAAKRGHEKLDVYRLAEQIVDANRAEDGGITDKFVDDILADGALDLISVLQDEEEGRWAFLTSGGEMTQTLKLAVVGIIVQERMGILARARIVSTESKAREAVDQWYDRSDGKFVVPADMVDDRHMRVDYVRIIDDKERNLSFDKDHPHGHRVATILVHPQELEPHADSKPASTITELIDRVRGESGDKK